MEIIRQRVDSYGRQTMCAKWKGCTYYIITRTFTLNVSVHVYTRNNSLSYLQVVNAPAVPVNTMAFVPCSTMTHTSASVTALIRGRLAIHVCDAIRCNITG